MADEPVRRPIRLRLESCARRVAGRVERTDERPGCGDRDFRTSDGATRTRTVVHVESGDGSLRCGGRRDRARPRMPGQARQDTFRTDVAIACANDPALERGDSSTKRSGASRRITVARCSIDVLATRPTGKASG